MSIGSLVDPRQAITDPAERIGPAMFCHQDEIPASDDEWFSGFTFDHVLDGTVVGHRDNRELFRIDVRSNKVTTRVLRRGDDPGFFGSEFVDSLQLRRRRGGAL